jgi:predicted transcriptional regulator
MIAGWIDWDDLGLEPQDVTRALHQLKFGLEDQFKYELLTHEESWSWVKQERFNVVRMGYWGSTQLRWLRDLNALDIVDREKVIQQIVSVQTLSGTPPGQPPIHDWRDVRGLFFTPRWPALQDTYFSLAALEILGGLDHIDREACIRGILRRHEGKGYFTSPDSGGYNEYHIDGSARDTIAAFESLRMLGALDRVKDLDQWQFRVASRRSSKPDPNGIRVLTWDEVEAWVCQQRLEKILRERKKNPEAPLHSLLEP